MSKQKTLYQLVTSLSKSEKRNYKLYINRLKGEKEYLKLFELLEQEDKFSPSLFQQHSRKNLDNLYNSITASLNIQSTSIKNQIQNLLNNIEGFFNRGILEGMKVSINKGEELCRKYEQFELLLPILDWEIRYFMLTNIENKQPKEIPTIYIKQQQVLEIISNKQAYWLLHYQLNLHIKQQIRTRSEEEKKEVLLIIKDPLLQHKEKALSLTAEMLWLRSWIIYYRYIGVRKELFEKIQQLFVFFEKNKAMQIAYQSVYLATLSNAFSITLSNPLTISQEEWRFFYLLKEKIECLNPKSNREKLLLFPIYQSFLQYYFYSDKKDYKRGETYLEKLGHEFSNYKSILKEEQLLLYLMNMVVIYFKLKKFEKSNHYLQQLFDLNIKTIRKDILSLSRIYQLLLHYESSDWKFIEKHTPSVKRFLQRWKMLYKVEETLLTFLTKAAILKQGNQKTSFSYLTLIKTVKTNLKQLVNDPYERHFVALGDIIQWIEDEITLESLIISQNKVN